MLARAPALLTPYRVQGRAAMSMRSCTSGPSFVFSHASLRIHHLSGFYHHTVMASESAGQRQRSLADTPHTVGMTARRLIVLSYGHCCGQDSTSRNITVRACI